MKPKTNTLLLLCLSLLIGRQAFAQSPANQAITMSSVQWTEQNFVRNKIPPFSFKYGGRDSKTFIRSWEFKKQKLAQTDPAIQDYIYSWHDRKSGLTATCYLTCFLDFPAVEWVIKFKNTSGKNSLPIEQVRAIDYPFKTMTAGPIILHHSLGSNAERSDFMSLRNELQTGESIYMTPDGGRSSDNTAFPFFNIEMPGGEGIIAAVGWSGKWYADVLKTDATTVELKSGMERMKLYLYPDEEIRTPRIALLYWKSKDRMDGHNQFRQFILAHHTRQIDGKPCQLPLASGLGYGGPQPPCNEYSCATETYAIAMAYRLRQFGVVPEVLWIDAGWYTGCGVWWANVGNWTVDKTRFPRGLKPVSDAIHEVGAKFILWFEPERVYKGTQFYKEQAKWVIKIPDYETREPYKDLSRDNGLFNLGDPDACAWLTKYIGDLIEKEGIDYYRQDFNFDPWFYWMYNDPQGREGISEIRHIEGLYKYWDGLLTRFPRLIIDNCASGGRRLDLETVSRSSPLWRTDYQYGEPNGYQSHTYGLNFYLPLHGTGNITLDPYTFRSSMSSALVSSWDINLGGYKQADLQKFMSDYKRYRPFYYADYYPLTPNENITSDSIWLAYQLNRPKEGDGMIVAFRRPDCPIEQISVKLRGLAPDATYELFFEDENLRVNKTGRELQNLLDLMLKEKRKSLIISYKKTN